MFFFDLYSVAKIHLQLKEKIIISDVVKTKKKNPATKAQKVVDNHKKAATHHETAALNHNEAAKHFENGNKDLAKVSNIKAKSQTKMVKKHQKKNSKKYDSIQK